LEEGKGRVMAQESKGDMLRSFTRQLRPITSAHN